MPIPPPGQIQTPAAVPVPIPIPAPPLSHSPEKIQPMPSRNSARSPSRHSVDIPPDNWIPTADGNSFIAMPPPHEFSIPIDANPTPRTNTRSLDGNDAGERGTRPPSRQQHPQVRTRDYAYADTAPSGSAPQPPPSRPRTNSGASRGSTRISQYDLVSPPRNQKPEDSDRKGNGDAYSVQSYTRRGREREREVQRERSRTPGLDSRTRRGQPESERIVEEWRSANPDVVTPRNSTDGRMPNDVR